MAKGKKENIFWPSMVDLMTSLFFIMLVLFAVVFLKQQNDIKRLKVKEKALEEIKKTQEAVENLSSEYFSYDPNNNRFRLKVDVEFKPQDYDINKIEDSAAVLESLRNSAKFLKVYMDKIMADKQSSEYLFIVEGNTQKFNDNYIVNPDAGYRLSYNRALALVNYWKKNSEINFESTNNKFELLIVGSGYFGRSRIKETYKNGVMKDDGGNKSFTIQIVPKLNNLSEFGK
jgi:hypothetical protein